MPRVFEVLWLSTKLMSLRAAYEVDDIFGLIMKLMSFWATYEVDDILGLKAQ